jgi:hypothetical protein
MRDDPELDRVIHERLAAAGPFDPAQFHPQVLRDVFALAARWRSELRADVAAPGTPPTASGAR